MESNRTCVQCEGPLPRHKPKFCTDSCRDKYWKPTVIQNRKVRDDLKATIDRGEDLVRVIMPLVVELQDLLELHKQLTTQYEL